MLKVKAPNRGSDFDIKFKNVNHSPVNPTLLVLIRIVSSRQF